MFGIYLLVLRFVHIIASVCWAGGAFIFFLFVGPTAKALAPMGMQFIQHMTVKRRFSIFMVVSSILSVLSGAMLVWQSAHGHWLAWVGSGPGLGFALGSSAGVAAFFVGMFGVNPRAIRLAKLGAAVQAAGGPPTPAQAQELERLDREMSTFDLIDFVLVALSLAFMATARFWLF